MISENFSFKSDDGTNIFVSKWSPNIEIELKGIVQIAHGMAEKASRYERFAEFLTSKGFCVYANDHRGHGRTAVTVDKLGILADSDGFDWMVRDVHQLTDIIKKDNPKLPLFLFGHSMGSFICQKYIQLFGKEVDGVILSGTNGKQGPILYFGIVIAKLISLFSGRNKVSPFLNELSFGAFNNSFKPNRTSFDWLSRDNNEVDKYINDEFCGTVFTAGFFFDFLQGLSKLHQPGMASFIPKNLPIYIFTGEKDPVGNFGKGVLNQYNFYKKIGIEDLRYKLYKDGRHEMLNEINRDEVMNDIVEWIKEHNN